MTFSLLLDKCPVSVPAPSGRHMALLERDHREKHPPASLSSAVCTSSCMSLQPHGSPVLRRRVVHLRLGNLRKRPPWKRTSLMHCQPSRFPSFFSPRGRSPSSPCAPKLAETVPRSLGDEDCVLFYSEDLFLLSSSFRLCCLDDGKVSPQLVAPVPGRAPASRGPGRASELLHVTFGDNTTAGP
jgi:hypothetical protein